MASNSGYAVPGHRDPHPGFPPPQRRAYIVLLTLEGIVASALVVASVFKLEAGPRTTELMLGALSLLPDSLRGFFALVLPFLELALATWLVTGLWPRAALTSTLILLGLFTVFLLTLLSSQGWKAHCGCMGALRVPIVVALIQDCALLLLTAAALRIARRIPMFNSLSLPGNTAACA